KPEFAQMFVDEAILGSHLSHPHIAHVEAFGEDHGVCYLVMEYIDGCSLTELAQHLKAREERLDVTVAVHIAVRVAEALHAAHEALDSHGRPPGVVHRDVSPGNILLSKRGNIKVVDFGIAKSEVQHTDTTGSFKGKLRYMSPEQAHGYDVDRR